MKIAVYKDTFANNRGADIAVRNLAAGLGERGHEVTLFDKAQFGRKIRGDYDVVVSAGTNEILDLAEVDGLPPIVQQFHTDPGYPFRHWLKRWRRNRDIKSALKKAAAYQVLSHAHEGALRKILRLDSSERVFAIGNWSAYEGEAKTAREEQKVILCPGAINNDKNQTLLVDAFAEAAGEFPDWQVHIYGKGKPKDEQRLLRRIAAKGLAGRIVLKGYADLAEPYANCAFVAFPSKTEGFGMAILDAALFGKPSLMIRDWIGCGEVAAEEDFADGLKRLMADESRRRMLGEKSRAFCSGHYSRQALLDKWEKALASIMV